MDACWFLAEIAKVFWYDRHPRLRRGKPSVPQVPAPASTSPDAKSSDARSSNAKFSKANSSKAGSSDAT
ncbi:hypothetical protein [Bradyrhizobium nitroreducens]|uniref:hypothetical protein n=1 Tax=Bradyrhizobium nitroreducens TaxID=709803 RepID=UPI000C1E15F8|nr:hypothetical protein [Bradyrhizobium nitroreducens]